MNAPSHSAAALKTPRSQAGGGPPDSSICGKSNLECGGPPPLAAQSTRSIPECPECVWRRDLKLLLYSPRGHRYLAETFTFVLH